MDETDVARAVAALRAGGVVVYPTETLYGLGADAFVEAALRRVAALKGRDAGKPVSVIVASRAMVDVVASRVPPDAERLADAFWPGPLTLALAARADLSPILTGGRGTIGVRVSSHPVACALAEALGKPITATSANPGGLPAATTAEEARRYFRDRIDAIVDGGRSPGGAASTIVDVSGGEPVLLREGAVALADVERVLRKRVRRARAS